LLSVFNEAMQIAIEM